VYREPEEPTPIEAHVWQEEGARDLPLKVGPRRPRGRRHGAAFWSLDGLVRDALTLGAGLGVAVASVGAGNAWLRRRHRRACVDQPVVRPTGTTLRVPLARRWVCTTESQAPASALLQRSDDGVLEWALDDLRVTRRRIRALVTHRHTALLPALEIVRRAGSDEERLWLLGATDEAAGLDVSSWASIQETKLPKDAVVVKLWPDELERLDAGLEERLRARSPARVRVAADPSAREASRDGLAEIPAAVPAEVPAEAPPRPPPRRWRFGAQTRRRRLVGVS
jgi:hypothetical protein